MLYSKNLCKRHIVNRVLQKNDFSKIINNDSCLIYWIFEQFSNKKMFCVWITKYCKHVRFFKKIANFMNNTKLQFKI